GPVDAGAGAARPQPSDARPDSGIQRVPLGGAHADRRGGHAAPRSAAGPGGEPRAAVAPRRRPRTEPREMKLPAPRPDWAYFFDIDGTLVDLADAPAGARNPGLVLEDKGLSLALHYRRAPRLAGYAHRLARSLLVENGETFGIQGGKRVVEIKPAGKDKGAAVLEFMHEDPFRGRT